MTRYWLVVLVSFSSFSSIAQSFRDYSILKFNSDDGIPHNSIYSICQDKEGRIWLGTENGLAYLKNGRFHPLGIAGIPKLILEVYPAKDGGIYVVGNNPASVVKINALRDLKVLHTRPNGVFRGPLTEFSALEEAIYYCDWKNIIRCTENSIDTLAAVLGTDLKSLTVLDREHIILNKSTGLFTAKDGRQVQMNGHSISSSLFIGDTLITLDKHSINSYRATDLELVRSVATQTLDDVNFLHPNHSTDGSLWYTGQIEGLYCFHQNRVISVHRQLGLTGIQFSALYEDLNGNIWCGTNGNGLYLLRKTDFTTLTTADGLTDNYVRGIFQLTEKTHAVLTRLGAHYLQKGDLISPLHLTTRGEKIPSIHIKYILRIDDKLYVGADYSLKVRSFRGFFNDTLPVLTIFSSVADLNDEYVNIGTWGKFVRIPLSQLDSPLLNQTLINGYMSGRTEDILNLDSGAVVATEMAIYYWNYITNEHHEMPGIPSSEVICSVNKDSKGVLWCLTGSKLYQWNGSEWFSTKENLLGKHTYSQFIIDSKDRFWMGSHEGLILIDGPELTVYTTHNGLASNEVISLAIGPEEKRLWVGTKNGLSISTLESLLDRVGPKVEVNFDSIYTLSGLHITNPEQTTLSGREKMITVAFSVNDYYGPLRVNYKYRLQGIGDQWFYTSEGIANFAALSHGDYSLEVSSQVSGSPWSDPQVLDFTINKILWQRWEFFLGVSLAIMLLTLFIYMRRVKWIRAREDEKRRTSAKMNELEMQALNANMNPHFIFNSLNSIQHYLIPLKNRKAFDFIANLSRLIRLNMGALGQKQVSLEGEIKRTELYVNLERERLNNRLSFEIQTDLPKSEGAYSIPSMIIQPLVENSIWHGIAPLEEMGTILLSISYEAPFLQIQVVDNGVGLVASAKSKNKNHTSVATKLTHERLKHHHKDNDFFIKELFDETGKVLGTEATIRIYIIE